MKIYSNNPSLERRIKPIKYAIKFIAQQYNQKANKGNITLEELQKSIDNEEKQLFFNRFKNIQIEIITLINRVIRLTATAEGLCKIAIDTKSPLSKESLKELHFTIYLNLKEAINISVILEALGDVWGVKELSKIGIEFKSRLETVKNELETNKIKGFKFDKDPIKNDALEKLQKELKRIDAEAPILLGYYSVLSQFEEFIGVYYE